MPFKLPALKDFKINKQMTLDLLEPRFDSIETAKAALYADVKDAVGCQIEFLIAGAAQPILDMAALFGDDPRPALIAEFGTVGNIETAEGIARALLAQYLPAAGQEGKWLAQFGFVAADWEQLVGAQNKAVDTTPDPVSGVPAFLVRNPPPAPPVIPAPPSRLAVALAASGDTLPPIIEEHFIDETKQSAPPAPPAGEPDKAAIGAAYAAFNEAATMDFELMSGKLGVSISTSRNWLTGKTPGKASTDQAKAMVAEIDRRIALLTDAGSVFAAVR